MRVRGLSLSLAILVGITLVPALASQSAGSEKSFSGWTRSGTGAVTDIAVGDLDGDGTGEVVVGGRGVGVIDSSSPETGRYRWTNKWIQPDGTASEGDWEFVREMEIADVTGDGKIDVVVGADNGFYLLDALTGETLWTWFDHRDETSTTHESFRSGANDMALADFNGDGTKDVVFGDLFDDGITAIDVKNRELLWFFPRQGPIMDIHAADLNGDSAPDVVVVGGAGDPGEIGVVAISGLGAPLWSQPYLGPGILGGAGGLTGDPVVIDVGSVLPGPTNQVVIGGANGQISVFEAATGTLRQAWATPRSVWDLALAEVDGDDQKEIVATHTDLSREPVGGGVGAYDGTGAPLWTQEAAGPPFDLELGANPNELIVGGGFDTPNGRAEKDGFVQLMKLGLTDTQRVIWTKLVTEHVKSVAQGDVHGQPTIVAGQNKEGDVAAFDASGNERWSYRTGGRIEELTTADLDGTGPREIIEVADDSAVAAHDSSGDLLWTKRVPGIGGSDVIEVAAANLDAEPTDEVIVGTWEMDGAAVRGRVHTYDADGAALWSVDQPGAVHSLNVTDIDGDADQDVITTTAIEGQVGRYTAAGGMVWETPIDAGIGVVTTLAYVNGDGVKDVIAGTKRFGPLGDMFAIDGANGDLLWHREGDPGVPGDSDGPILYGINWFSAKDNEIALGDVAGRVYEIDPATGAQVDWIATPGGSSWDGGWTIDANGDGTRDVVSASEDNATRVLSGVDGSVLWTTETPDIDHDRGFQVETVAVGDKAVIATGTFGIKSYLQLLDAKDGDELSKTPLHSFVLEVTTADLSEDGVPEVLVGAGWNLHVLKVPLAAPPPTPGNATTDLIRDRSVVGYKQPFDLEGTVARDANCTGPLTVEILKRTTGSTSFTQVGAAGVAPDNTWSLGISSQRSAAYIARVATTATCVGAQTAPVAVGVRARLEIIKLRSCPTDATVIGRVLPNLRGSKVLLQRRRGSAWKTVTTDRLSASSRFALKLGSCKGTYRVFWPKQASNESATARLG
jgi:PQQ-like domain